MPPSADPWGSQDPSLPQDAEPSTHANNLDPDDPEASHFLDNLDMSDFEPCEFDFSSLMDLDQIDDAALLETLDSNMTDMSTLLIGDVTAADLPVLETNNFQASATFDPEPTLVFDETWRRDAHGSAEFGFATTAAPTSLPGPSNATNVLSPSLVSNNLGLPENCHSWGHGGNICQFPTASISSNTISIPHVAPAPSYFYETDIPSPALREHAQGSQSFVSQPVPGPIIRHRGPLPPARRGGRRGRLTREQAERQLVARANGVCIRCRFMGITCEGGFPCKACVALRKPRLWRSPCTKAQFLEIIESESFFLSTSILRYIWIDTLNVNTANLALWIFESGKGAFPIDFIGKRYDLDWSFGLRGLRLLCFPGDFRKPSPDQIRETEKQLLREYPSDIALDFLWGLQRPDKFHWVSTLAFFCSKKHFSNPHEEHAARPPGLYPELNFEVTDQLLWFYSRYGELCLFRYLQEKANNPSRAIEDQKAFICSALFILKHSLSQERVQSPRMGGISPDAQREIDGHLDRQTRVRTALWIFASVFVSKLPAFTDFWSHLPEEIDIFKHRPRESLQKSLVDIDTDLLVSLDAIFNQKKKLLSHLFPAEYGYWTPQQETCEQDYTRRLWRRMQSNTPEGIREIEQISACQPANLSEKVRLYEQNEAERAMVPKTREQQWETARRFFGRLLSAMESPIIRNEASFNEPDGSLRPSSLTFLILLSRFTRRIPGRCPNHARGYTERPAVTRQHVDLRLYEINKAQSCLHGAASCFKASQRWLTLASLLGDGAYLMGTTKESDRHPFLEVESVVERGTDSEFSRLTRLLSSNGSWIRATCNELNGLVQALIQIDTNRLAQIRVFQHLLGRKCRRAFGDVVSSEGGRKPSPRHQLILEDMRGELRDLLPSISEVGKGRVWVHDTLEIAILQVIEDISTGKEEAPEESHLIVWISRPISLILNRFIQMYDHIMARWPTHWENATRPRTERMKARLHEAMQKFMNWYINSTLKPLESSEEQREEVSAAFLGFISS